MMCKLGSEGGKCSQNSDDTWQCKNYDDEPYKCTPGLYPGWADCNNYCMNGACSLNAGEDGIRCTC
jgi:hypothetical protein